MKLRWTVPILLSCLMLPQLAAESVWYLSNELMMPLEKVSAEEARKAQYALEVASDGDIFYRNGEVTAARSQKVTDGRKEVSISYSDGTWETRKYRDDLLQKIEQGGNGVDTAITFSYSEDQLTERKEVSGGQMILLTTYYRHADGTLAGTREIDRSGESRLAFYTMDHNLVTVTRQNQDKTVITEVLENGLMAEAFLTDGIPFHSYQAEYDENGNLILSEQIGEDSRVSIYTSDGKLSSVKTVYGDGRTGEISYTYDGAGILTHSNEITQNGKRVRIERWYTSGTIKTETQWIDDVPQKSTRYSSDDTSVVTIFEDGHPYADVTYAADGERILSIEYRKEQ